jgi:hypothetical protein
MRIRLFPPLIFLFGLIANSLLGQTVFYTESFESTSGYSFPNGNGRSGQDFFDRTNLSSAPAQESFTYSGFDGSFFIAGEDIDGTLSSSTGIVLISNIDITSYTNLEFRGAFASGTDIDIDDLNDAMWVEIRIDGSAWQEIGRFEADPSTTSSTGFNGQFAEDTNDDFEGDGVLLSGNFTDFIWPITGTGSVLDVRISMSLDSGDEEAAFDNIRIAGIASAGSCSITSNGLSNIVCNDNGTPSDPSDDITSFQLNPTGSDLGSSYSVDMDGFTTISTSPSGPFTNDVAAGISYGSPTTFYLEPGSAGIGGDLDGFVIDSDDSNCFDIITITDPGSCSAGSGGGTSCPLELDFETTGGYTTTPSEFVIGGSDYFTRSNGLNISSSVELTNIQGNFFFGGQDIIDSGDPVAELMIMNVSISGLSNLVFSINLAEDDDGSNEDWDVGDYVHIFYSIDGGAEQNLLWIENDGATFNSAPFIDTDFDGDGDGTEITDTFQTFSQSISGTGASIDIRIEFSLDSGDEDIALDNIQICGTAPVGCVHNVGDYFPLTGPAGTEITISGTGFTPLSEVFLGSTSANVIYQTTDTLIAEIPAGAGSGNIFVDEADCLVDAGSFNYLSEDCTVGSPTLIISELCDPSNDFQTDRYIEIYNPTNQTINLSGWELFSISNGGVTDQSCLSWSLFGDIDPGEALTCGYTSPVNGGPHDFQNPNWITSALDACAFNWNGQERDGAALYNGSTLIDGILIDFESSDSLFKDNSLVRNSSICSSNPNSDIADWSGSLIGVQVAGSGPSTPGSHNACTLISSGNPITISSQPSDLSEPICNEPTLTLSASAGSAISYQWFVNDGSDDWTPITNGPDYSGATTSNLTILSLTGKDGYQYYCEMSTGASNDCLNYSNAVQLEVLPNDRLFFRSASVSGEWTNPAIWEFSLDGSAGSYSNACIYPDANNSDEIRISNGNSIIVDAEIEVSKVIIEENGTLQTLVTTFLTFDELASGAEFEVNGTWIDNGSTGNSIQFQNGASWVLGSNGTMIKTNTSSVANYRNNYEGGILNIPATSNWIYRREGDNDVSVAATNMVYPNLTFENNLSGLYIPSSSVGFFDGSTATAIIKGNLDIGGSGSGQYLMRTNNFNNSPILVQGDLIIRSGSGFTSDDAGGENDGTGLEVWGNLEIEGDLDMSSTAADAPLRGQLRLTGSTDQEISGNGTIDVSVLAIDKIVGNVFSDMLINVETQLVLATGILDFKREGTGRLRLNFDGDVTGGSANSYGSGPFQKTGIFSDVIFEYPVGDYRIIPPDSIINVYNPAYITPSSTSPEVAFVVEYFHENFNPIYTNPNNPPPSDGSLTQVSTCNYWDIAQEPSSSEVEAIVGVSWGGSDCIDIQDTSSLALSRFNNFAWDNMSILYGQNVISSSAPDYNNGIVSTTSPFPAFGPFTIGATGAGPNILPITLLSFSAKAEKGKVRTEWITASETNNDYFTIERSKDGRDWEKIGTVDGAGNSTSELTYRFADERPYSGISYYRLRQTDFDGESSLSEVRSVEIAPDGEFSLDRVYHGHDGLNLIYRSAAPYIVVEIYDLLGKRVHGELLENYGSGFGTVYPDIARGAYLMRISHGNEVDSEKFIY